MTSPDPAHLAWLNQWREAGQALAEERRSRLAALTDEQALAAADAVLSLAAALPDSARRRTTSGLVEQQALFSGQRPR
jgi:hypothetical protein